MTELSLSEVEQLWEQGLTSEERFVLYRREGINVTRIAACETPGAIGLMLTTLHEEGELLGRIGLRDAVTRKWILNPYSLTPDWEPAKV